MKKSIFTTLLIGNLVVFIFILFSVTKLSIGLAGLIYTLQSKIEIYELQRQFQILRLKTDITNAVDSLIRNDKNILKINKFQQGVIKEVTKNLIDLGKLSIDTDEQHFKLIRKIITKIELIEKTQQIIKRELEASETIDLANIQEIKKANLILYNLKHGISCSGSHIKIDNQSYVLTCYHILENPEDSILAVMDNGDKCLLELVKFDKRKDLALFKLPNIETLPYFEISDRNPKEGSKIIVIGNPSNLKDVITDGTIAKVERKGYLFTNKIYFGNSGGAVLYKGKIVGVVLQMRTYGNINRAHIYIHYGYSSKIETIREFLKEVE